MHTIDFIRLALVIGAATWLVISIKRNGMRTLYKVIGGVIGGFLGFIISFSLAAIYVWQGGDPTAAGVFSFFGILTVPLGIGIGVAVGSLFPRGKVPLDKDKVDDNA